MTTKINHLQLLQQNLQNILLQKQQIETQLSEFSSALQELQTTPQAYKIVGKLMISASKEDLIRDLDDKKEISELRLKNILKQEEQLKKNLAEVQKEVLEEMKDEKSAN